MERELFSTQYPGDIDDPWPIYQAKKIVWRRQNFQEKIFDQIEKELLEIRYGNRVQAINDFVESILKAHPWSAFIYYGELDAKQKTLLKDIFPVNYQNGNYPVGEWRSFIKTLLGLGLAEQIPGLNETTREIFAQDQLNIPVDRSQRAVNNFYYAFYENIPKGYDKDLVGACWKFKKTQRKILKTILGDETCQKLHALLDYRNWVIFGNKYTIRHERTKKLIKQPLGEAIKQAKAHYKKQPTSENLLAVEQAIASRAIELTFSGLNEQGNQS